MVEPRSAILFSTTLETHNCLLGHGFRTPIRTPWEYISYARFSRLPSDAVFN